MSYQVLARKWRPGSFEDLVGQDHVVKALSNALEGGQLHHAYLFTGTRGVGKTTLARILSKALNCKQGVGARPCGYCSACREINEGRFVDLLEVDAASRTKVDQTRELLDNVPFAPVKGRFKVYLIDEVHMFSAHSFNALLKTLEEPPPHVKFLLATTDPQKVPATVLSRCLQFNLKRLVPEQIVDRFSCILEAEGIAFEPQALALLAQAADGSMRDGLSLLDQSIAFGGGKVVENEVRTMLGTVGRELGLNLLQALAGLDRPGLLDEVTRIAELTPDFASVLQELIGLLHRVALYQEVPATLREGDPERERIADLAGQLAPEDVQLFYQVALLGQQDLPLAPDPRTGIEMVLLRMLTFRPDAGNERRTKRGLRESDKTQASARDIQGSPSAPGGEIPAGRAVSRQPIEPSRPPWDTRAAPVAPPPPVAPIARPGAAEHGEEDTALSQAVEAVAGITVPESHPRGQGLRGPEDWHQLVAGLGVGGVASELANNCELAGWDGHRLSLMLGPVTDPTLGRGFVFGVGNADLHLKPLSQYPGQCTLQPLLRGGAPQILTLRAQHQATAEALMEDDPVVRSLRDEFDARWVPGSIEPTQ